MNLLRDHWPAVVLILVIILAIVGAINAGIWIYENRLTVGLTLLVTFALWAMVTSKREEAQVFQVVSDPVAPLIFLIVILLGFKEMQDRLPVLKPAEQRERERQAERLDENPYDLRWSGEMR